MSCENKSQVSALPRLETAGEVEAILGKPPSMIMLKQVGALDEGCRAVLAHCPLAGFGYRDAGGVSRTTFIGGTPGFVRVHSPTRISNRCFAPANSIGRSPPRSCRIPQVTNWRSRPPVLLH